jgi:hypothetical protein
MTIYREESFATNLAIEYNLGFNILDSKIYYTMMILVLNIITR